MKAIEFDGANMKIAEHQDQYNTLPAFFNIKEGSVIACFELSDEELKAVNETKRIYYKQLTFGKPMNPMLMSTNFDELQTLTEKDLNEIGFELVPDNHEVSHEDFVYFQLMDKLFYQKRQKKEGD